MALIPLMGQREHNGFDRFATLDQRDMERDQFLFGYLKWISERGDFIEVVV